MDWLNFSLTLPVTDPTWIFLLVLLIILFAPILLNKLRIPHIIGMILAGLVIGEHGFNILVREESRKGCDAGIAGFRHSDRHRLGYQYDVAEV